MAQRGPMCLRMAKGLWGPLPSLVALSIVCQFPTVHSCLIRANVEWGGVGYTSGFFFRNSSKPLNLVVKFQLLPVPGQEWMTGDQWPWLGTGHSGH